MNYHLISFMIFTPLFGAVLQGLLSGRSYTRWLAFGASVLSSLCALGIATQATAGIAESQLAETFSWIGAYAINYDVSIDGLNGPAVFLIAIVFPVLIAAEWNHGKGRAGLHAMFLLLQGSLVGALCAQDLFLMFFFWALSSLPFYFLIGVWGGQERESAAFRSIVSAALGNSLFFAALVLVYYAVDPHSFSIKELSAGRLSEVRLELFGFETQLSQVAFILMGAGLALRTPIWPVHGWYTRAAAHASSTVFVSLSAVAIPVAATLFMRLSYSLFPEVVAGAAPVLVVLGAVNLLVGGICAVAQTELRLLLAFVCMSQMGLWMMGVGSLSPAGAVGAIYHLLVFGLAAAGFGLFAGLVIDRVGTDRFIVGAGDVTSAAGGIASKAPALATFVGIVVASLLGFPGSGGFVGQSLLVIGGYSFSPWVLVLAAGSFLLATYYLFTMYRCVFLGAVSARTESFVELTLRERACFFTVVVGLLVFGVYPKPLLELVRPTAQLLLSWVNGSGLGPIGK